MLSPLFFHSFRVDFQHSAWRIRHTNHSQLLMGIAQMVEELVQNKKNQLKPSKTWEEPAVNFAGWVDLPFLLLILPSCKLPTGSSGSGTGKRPPEIQKWWENFPSLWEQPLGLDEQSWVALGDAQVLQPLGEQGRALTWEKRHFDVPMFLCGCLERLKNYKWTGRKFRTYWSGLSECSLEKELWYLNNICIFVS